MKKLLLIAALTISAPLVMLPTGCTTAPFARVVEVQTLKAVGQSADAAIALSAQLYRDGKITAAQARQVADFYDHKFQPAFRVAATAVQYNLSSVASPDLANLASQLSALVIQFQNRTP